ncbi:MAG: 2-dehydropantoate 2-reductase, partial [Victivallaceae bacterium]
MMDKIKILIVGAGAVGSYYGGRLAQNLDTSVAVVCRSDYETVKQNGFDIKSIEGDFIFRPNGVFRSCAEYSDSPDYIIITTKVLPEIDIVSNIRPAVKANTSIVLIQNGIDIEKHIAAAFPNNELISGIAYIGTGRDGAGKVRHQGGGRLRFGLYPEGHSEKLDILVELFKKA